MKRLSEFFGGDNSQIQKEEEKKDGQIRNTLGAPMMKLDDILAELDEPLSLEQQNDLEAKTEAAEERKSKIKLARQSDLNKFVARSSEDDAESKEE